MMKLYVLAALAALLSSTSVAGATGIEGLVFLALASNAVTIGLAGSSLAISAITRRGHYRYFCRHIRRRPGDCEMTCFIARRYDDRVEVLCDTALWHRETLAVTGITSKVIQIGSLPLVMASRGEMLTLAQYAIRLEQLAPSTVDGAVEAFQALLHRDRDAGVSLDGDQDFLLAGWSESAGPLSKYAIASGSTSLPGDLWRLADASEFYAATVLTNDDFDEAGFYVDDFRHGLHHYGVKLLREARLKKQTWGGKPLVAVGGTVMLTTVRPNGVTHEPMGGWPDLVGLPIKREAEWIAA